MAHIDEQGHGEPDNRIRHAIDLMRAALRLLDVAKASVPANHLQMALDTASPAALAGADGEEQNGDPAITTLLSDPPLVRAMGGALGVLTSLLKRNGLCTFEEAAQLLGMYAVVTAETAPDEGLILGCWGGMLRDLAEQEESGGIIN